MKDHATLTLNDANFTPEVLESDRPVLVDFWAEWCPPCRVLGPTIEQIAVSHSDSAKVGKLDVDANPVSASEYGITSLPSVLIFKAGARWTASSDSSRDRVTSKPCNRRAPDPSSAPMCCPRWSCDGDRHSGDSRPAHCVYKVHPASC